MKKELLVLMLLMIACLKGLAQEIEQVNVTLDIDDAARVRISLAGEILNELQDGSNTLSVTPWSNILIEAAEGYILRSVTKNDGQEISISDLSSANILLTYSEPEITYVIVTERETEISFTFWVDDASAIRVTDRNYSAVSLTDGENRLSMSPRQLPLIIGPAVYGEGIYSVSLDGEEIPYEYGYVVTPSEGSRIVVTVAFPDTDCSVVFEAKESIDNFFTDITVNGESRNFKDGLTVKCGDTVAIFYNPDCWLSETDRKPVIVTINGEQPSWFGPGYSFIVRSDTEVIVEQAVPAPMILITVSIDTPA
ncbi:MAG: hypothetical protein K2H75_09485, partial [Muribaculaceae bacterium]|nr:hypothetical protein [Muribaculaceae bacterium]